MGNYRKFQYDLDDSSNFAKRVTFYHSRKYVKLWDNIDRARKQPDIAVNYRVSSERILPLTYRRYTSTKVPDELKWTTNGSWVRKMEV